MRYAIAALCLLMCASPAAANPVETKSGQIVCLDLDAMQEYVKALAAADRQWLGQIKSCVLSVPGSKMGILDRNVASGGIPNVARVRIFRKDGGDSVLGYAILEAGQ